VSSPQIGSADPVSPTRRQRAPSPLKRQYAPSPGSSSASHYSDDDSSDAESATSDSSLDDFSRASYLRLSGSGIGGDQGGSGGAHGPRTLSATPSSVFSGKPLPSITPSQSASQAARGTNYWPGVGAGLAPPALAFAPARFAASIFSWSDDAGAWASLHAREVLVIVSPGLIEAFDVPVRSEHRENDGASVPSSVSSSSNGGAPPVAPPAAPLLALELTPLVPLRRGTAIDISVRSPPTPASALAARCAANPHVMFRARAAGECDALYAAINCARIHNPTYIALHAARAACSAMYVGLWMRAQLMAAYRASHSPAARARNMTCGFAAQRAASAEAGVGGERTEMSMAVPRRSGTSGVSSSARSGAAGGATGGAPPLEEEETLEGTLAPSFSRCSLRTGTSKASIRPGDTITRTSRACSEAHAPASSDQLNMEAAKRAGAKASAGGARPAPTPGQ